MVVVKEKGSIMKKVKASVNYILGLIMSIAMLFGLFISTYGYNTDEIINYNSSSTTVDARKIYHSLGNGFTSFSFKNGGMILQSIFQILFILTTCLLIIVCLLGIFKKFGLMKPETFIKETVLKSCLNWGSIVLLLFEILVLVGYIIASKTMYFSLGLSVPFNLIVIVLCIFGTKILEAKMDNVKN